MGRFDHIGDIESRTNRLGRLFDGSGKAEVRIEALVPHAAEHVAHPGRDLLEFVADAARIKIRWFPIFVLADVLPILESGLGDAIVP